jgi:WD40 repeat protein
VYNLDTGALVRTYVNGHQGMVESITFKGRTLITSGQDCRIILWNLYSIRHNISLQTTPVRLFECSEVQRKVLCDETNIVTVPPNGKVMLWNEIALAA